MGSETTERGHGEKRRKRDAREEDDDGMGSEAETQRNVSMNVNMNRPSRECKRRAANGQTERRETGHRTRKRATARIRYVESGTGRGRIPLAQAIVVRVGCVLYE